MVERGRKLGYDRRGGWVKSKYAWGTFILFAAMGIIMDLAFVDMFSIVGIFSILFVSIGGFFGAMLFVAAWVDERGKYKLYQGALAATQR
jgi:hypothetical protein